MTHPEILFLPNREAVRVPTGTPLLEAAQKAAVDLEAPCNGKGTCGKCRVQLVEGALPTPHHDELGHLSSAELASGVRLACRQEASGNSVVRLVSAGRGGERILCDGLLPAFELDPPVTKRLVVLPPATLEDNCDDLTRLERALGCELAGSVSLEFLRQLPHALRHSPAAFKEPAKACTESTNASRAGGWPVTVVFHGGRPIGIEPGDTRERCYGVAVDIGTTTVVAALIDLASGAELATASMVNPQKAHGLDVLSRIQRLKEEPAALDGLTALIRGGLDQLLGELCEEARVSRDDLYELVVAANATMTHLLLGIDPSAIGSSPYVPAFSGSVELPAAELGLLLARCARVYCLPAVSGYIGADIVAGLLASELESSDRPALLIDIGTNGEMVLGSAHGLTACSCAAGPALEGMNISCGMRAAQGAIERVELNAEVATRTIGDAPALGICGSGIIDAVAELVKVGAVLPSGRFDKSSAAGEAVSWRARLKNEGAGRFILAEAAADRGEVAVSQKDIRQVQLAKGAILSGILSLTAQLGIRPADIDRIYLAGAFGHRIRKESLGRLGMVPAECLDRAIPIGNSSKAGAIMALLSLKKRALAEQLARRVGYVELSCYPGYDRLFAEALAFPKERA
ncbi:ferredoxin [Geomonas silvestris]|uniref:Ferredoxin n=1 Tax=Geomonas silvestris TaxID=2740184 RepID=A0A6V8MKU4_9BACT|nr:ASKHA domain-containing protein [Geomonas silvestris]GFO60618.1 ferredoxin [Geomonas silvestris]